MTLNEILSRLSLIEQQRSRMNYTDEFTTTVRMAVSTGDPDSIGALLGFLDDSHSHDEVMYALIHAIETFPTSIYVRQILRHSDTLTSHTPKWASIMFARILNSREHQLELIKQVTDSNEVTKAYVRRLLEAMNVECPELLARTIPVIVATQARPKA